MCTCITSPNVHILAGATAQRSRREFVFCMGSLLGCNVDRENNPLSPYDIKVWFNRLVVSVRRDSGYIHMDILRGWI